MPIPTAAEVVTAMAELNDIALTPERASVAAVTTSRLALQALAGERWLAFESEPSGYAERLERAAEKS